MIPIAHRGIWTNPQQGNNREALEAVLRKGVGFETDIRSLHGQLYLSHDAVSDPKVTIRFDTLLEMISEYPPTLLFLNIKEDGLLPLLLDYRHELESLEVVFFDMSVPELVKYSKHFPPEKLSTRVSDFEPVPSAVQLCQWIWVDGFQRSLTMDEIESLARRYPRDFAFVSPEIHGRTERGFWKTLKDSPSLKERRIAICTDTVGLLQQELNAD